MKLKLLLLYNIHATDRRIQKTEMQISQRKTSMPQRLLEGAEGSFACQAKNLAGIGERCSVKVNGPVAAFVAETDYTYLAFGAGAVVVALAAALVGIVICRSSCLSTTRQETAEG